MVGYDPRAEAKARAADPTLETAPGALDAADGADAVLVATEWAEFRTLDWTALGDRMAGRLVYDTRDVVDVAAAETAGFTVERLGGRGGDRSTAGAATRA